MDRNTIVDVVHGFRIRGDFGGPLVGNAQTHRVIFGAIDLQLRADAGAGLGIGVAGRLISPGCNQCIDVGVDDHGKTYLVVQQERQEFAALAFKAKPWPEYLEGALHSLHFCSVKNRIF